MKKQSVKQTLTTREKKLIKEAYEIGYFHASDPIAKLNKYPMGGENGIYAWCLASITLKEKWMKL